MNKAIKEKLEDVCNHCRYKSKCTFKKYNLYCKTGDDYALVLEIETLKSNAIEILKEKLDISFYNYKVNNEDIYEIMINGVLKGYTQEEYHLLKKVLGDEK